MGGAADSYQLRQQATSTHQSIPAGQQSTMTRKRVTMGGASNQKTDKQLSEMVASHYSAQSFLPPIQREQMGNKQK